jgi:acetylornithine/succinyldiaminopimelate/putrescine aminotransferase
MFLLRPGLNQHSSLLTTFYPRFHTPSFKEVLPNMLTTEEYAELSARYCAPTHLPIPIVIQKGEGARLRDIDGKEYIDFLSSFSVANQGHSHPHIVKAMIDQCQKIALCTSALQNETYPPLCKKICDVCRRCNYRLDTCSNLLSSCSAMTWPRP